MLIEGARFEPTESHATRNLSAAPMSWSAENRWPAEAPETGTDSIIHEHNKYDRVLQLNATKWGWPKTRNWDG